MAVLGEGEVSYERGTLVPLHSLHRRSLGGGVLVVMKEINQFQHLIDSNTLSIPTLHSFQYLIHSTTFEALQGYLAKKKRPPSKDPPRTLGLGLR